MSCIPASSKFRLLDCRVGWEDAHTENVHVGPSVELLRLIGDVELVDESTLSMYLLPRRIAKTDCCDWVLATPTRQSELASRILKLGVCDQHWRAWYDDAHLEVASAYSIAADGDRVVIVDAEHREVSMWLAGSGQRLGDIEIPGAVVAAFTPDRHVAIVSARQIIAFDLALDPVGVIAELPTNSGAISRMTIDADGGIWIAIRSHEDLFTVMRRRSASDSKWEHVSIAEIRDSLVQTGLSRAGKDGFCITSRLEANRNGCGCFSWYGRAIEPIQITAPRKLYAEKGQLLTGLIDSGLSRCRWHRVRLDADIPSGTSLSVSVATTDSRDEQSQGEPSNDGWSTFAEGIPHPADWQSVEPGQADFLVDRSPGRYLLLRLRLSGDGQATPSVRQVRLDFPRSTSLDFLPATFRDNPVSEDFTERFLSLFDALIEDVDRTIERYPALLNPDSTTDAALPWLARFLALTVDPNWDAAKQRAILRELPDLYKRRGTRSGLIRAFELAFDVTPEIHEMSRNRSWGGVDSATLGQTRLFSRAKSRFRLGNSALSSGVLKSFGNPDVDPLNDTAYRFTVKVPPSAPLDRGIRSGMEQLIDNQKPAHTQASLHTGGSGFVVGIRSSAGIDSAFMPVEKAVLGSETSRLDRSMVLSAAARSSSIRLRTSPIVGVGINTVME